MFDHDPTGPEQCWAHFRGCDDSCPASGTLFGHPCENQGTTSIGLCADCYADVFSTAPILFGGPPVREVPCALC